MLVFFALSKVCRASSRFKNYNIIDKMHSTKNSAMENINYYMPIHIKENKKVD